MFELKSVLLAVNSALATIKTVADMPGVNLLPYVSTVSSAIGMLQSLEAAGENIIPLANRIRNTFSGDRGTIPSQTDLDSLNAHIAELEGKIKAPLPPKEVGESE